MIIKNNKDGITLIFAIVVITALTITSLTLNNVILNNIERVGDVESVMQAQSAANSAFESALVYISTACPDAGCDFEPIDLDHIMENYDLDDWLQGQGQGYLDDLPFFQDNNDGTRIIASYKIEGESGMNGMNYYVPIPGYGDAGGETCNSEAPSGDLEDPCNWNTIYYGETVEIPLYTGGNTEFGGNTFNVKIRTPECEGNDNDCSAYNNRKLISCTGNEFGEFGINISCDYENDPVVMTWEISGDCGGSSCYSGPNDKTNTDWILGEYRHGDNSEINATLINSEIDSISYTILNINSKDQNDTLLDSLIGNSGTMDKPILKLTFAQSISNTDGSIPYLEYQIETDLPISNNTSQISVTGYVETDGEIYYWEKEGSWTSFTESTINFAFQN